MTTREKYLTRLVENALGLEGHGDDNVFAKLEKRGDEPVQQAPQYSEGSEMANETVIPEYKTIEELMSSIQKGTDKIAEEHKIQEMKKIAEALRMKGKKMEESEHAQHINPKDLKQLAKDAAALEKAAEKLKAAFDKKFNKKEKAAAPKAEKEIEKPTLQENTMKNTFDLKKFLVENKMTTNSRLIAENSDMGEKMQFFKDFLEYYAQGMDEGSILEMLEEEYDIPQDIDMNILEKATSELDLAINDIYTAIFESDNY